jgi:hypothetical protein
MKAPTCKQCKGQGTIHIEGMNVSQPIDLTCWVCGGTALKGMNPGQVKWYLFMYKQFETLKEKLLRKADTEILAQYNSLKNAINKACMRLKIAQNPVRVQRSTKHGVTDQEVFLRAELSEYERRLTAIPQVIAKIAA